MKKYRMLLAALMLALLLCGNALAASVAYEGGAEKFVFLPGSAYSPSDLFEEFKNVMPGDVLTQTVRVQNDTSARVRIYMRAEAADSRDRDFLGRLQLNVVCKDASIFDASAAETAQLTQNVLLGTFKKGGGTDLTVSLTVPMDLESKYMGRSGAVKWTFLAEDVPVDTTPDTGDWFRMEIWIALAAVLAAVLLVLLRRRRAEEN